MLRNILITFMLITSAQAADQPAADLILTNGRIITLDTAQPEAEAVAVRASRIVFVGSAMQAANFRNSETIVLNVQGRTILPGLIDAHAHLAGLGRTLTELDLRGVNSPQTIRDCVLNMRIIYPPGSWICGRGWDQNDWTVQEFPTWRDLKGTEANPVYLRRVDGHAVWLNKTALKLCGITKQTPDTTGGKILRDSKGKPTGILLDNAIELAKSKLPNPTTGERIEWLQRAMVHCNQFGLTGVHDAGVDSATLELYQQLQQRGALTLRVTALLDDENREWLKRQLQRGIYQAPDGFLTIRAVKLYADGALGSRGAALLEPYSDAPAEQGLFVNSPEYLLDMTRQALSNGFQVCTHAIGDAANRLVLDTFEQALSETLAGDYRLRIEHAQVISPEDLPRFAKLNVIASMQPTHATSDWSWAEARLGAERLQGAYSWRSLWHSGCRIACGSDFPVEPANPLLGIYAACTRQDVNGDPPGGWRPEQRLTLAEALRSFTLNAAYAGFSEKVVGSIAVGKLADFTILDGKLTSENVGELPHMNVWATIVNGKVVYRRVTR